MLQHGISEIPCLGPLLVSLDISDLEAELLLKE
jgi:hypothetical protein